MSVIVFDIETSPLPEGRLRELCPPFDIDDVKFDPAVLADFDPASVKYGNTTDPAKRAAKLEESREKHAAAQAAARAKLAGAEAEHWEKFVSRAALSACTAHVAAIGYHDAARKPPAMIAGVPDLDAERGVIEKFWRLACKAMASNGGLRLVGHNIFGFDLPFLLRRSWILGAAPPAGVIDRNHRYWHGCFVDTMAAWGCGVYGDRISLNDLARGLDCGAKPDDCTGAEFARLYYSGNSAKRATAEAYLLNDLAMTAAVAARLGVA